MHWGKFHQGQEPRKCIYSVPAHDMAKHRTKFDWPEASGERRRCSNEGNTRNQLKFAGVPQTPEPISAVSRPKFAIYCGDMWRTYCCLGLLPIVDKCLSCEDTAGQSCAMVRRWRFLAIFCVVYFQRDACGTFQTCILNSH